MDIEVIRDELLTIAEARLACYSKLISLAEEQRELLMAGRHAELAGNLSRHDPVLAELCRLEGREELLEASLGPTGESRQPEDFECRRRTLAAETSDAALKLRSLTETNKELLTNAANFVGFSIGIISQLVGDQPAYSPEGERAAVTTLVLDRRA